MPSEKRHGAGVLGDQEGLGENWKSAQCVTSLYDSYIHLQQENDQLREDIRQLQNDNALAKAESLREPQHTRHEELEQEVRLLRSEKLRMEEAHRLEIQKLESRAASSETQHQQLVTKYQEKFEFDPLESKRAAMAVKTMQNTLQNVVLEKEEIGIRYGELKEQYRKFYNEQMQIVEDLQKKVKMLEQQRMRVGQQRVVNALATWSTNKVQNAWDKWIGLVKNQRLKEENKKMMNSFERTIDERVAKIRGNQAAVFVAKLMQQSARRTFVRWRELARRNIERRCKGTRFAEVRCRILVKRIINCWRAESRKGRNHRNAVLMIERLLTCRSRCWGMRKWSIQTFRLVLVEKDQSHAALNGTMETQAKTIVDLEIALNETRNASRELQIQLQIRHEQEKADFEEKTEKYRAAELLVRQKMGRFLTKQSDRQLLKEIVREWRIMAKYLQGVSQRSELIRAKLRTLKLQRAVATWHGKAYRSHKKNHKNRVVAQQILARIRQLGALRCFNSWKECVYDVKARKKALLHAVNRIRNRGVARCFSQWTAFRDERVSLRNGIEVLTNFAMKQQAFFRFTSWRELVSELKIRDQVRQQQLIQKAWENRLVQAKRDLNFQRECFVRWHNLVLERQRRDVVVKRCLARMKNGSLAKMLGSWGDFVEYRKAQRELVRRWVSRCHTAVLQRAWSRWQRQIVLKEQQLLLLRVHEERNTALKQLETEFSEYRKTQQVLFEEAEQRQTEQEGKLMEIKTSLQEETKRTQRFAGAVEILCSTRARESTQLWYFRSWQKAVIQSVRNRRTINVFRSTLNARQSRTIILKWRQQTRLKAVFVKIQSCFSRWWQLNCFKAWTEAKRRNRAVKVFSIVFLRNSEMYMSRDVFTAWKKLSAKNHLLRKTLEKIWLGSVHAKMQQQFSHWIEFTKAAAAKEQLEKRNVALTAIRAKVWWKRSVSIMRYCFSEWKNTVESRKKHCQAERKLILFQQTRPVKICFNVWAEFVTAKGEEQHRSRGFARWLRKVQRRKQQYAMGLWKMLLFRHQQRDLQDLVVLRDDQQKELQSQREEISLLMQTAVETKRKLADITGGHDESTAKVQYLTECGLMAKYFNALKLKVSIRKYQRQAIHICHKNARRRYLTELFSNWYSYYQRHHAVKLIVAQKSKRFHDVLTRNVLQRWQSIAYQQRVIKQKQYKLRQRARVRIIKANFREWHRSIHREMKVETAVKQLKGILRILTLKSSLRSWHQNCLQERNRELRKTENHKKIMQFLMGRQEAELVRTFHSWKEFTWTQQATRSRAQQHYIEKCHILLAKCWNCWCSTVKTAKTQRRSAIYLQTMIKRYYYRVAMSRWRRYRFMSQISSLKSGNEKLVMQVAESTRQIQNKSMNVDQLSSELIELQSKLHEAESKSSAVNLQVTTQAEERSKQFICLNVLSKLMQKQFVSRDISEAFTLWKAKMTCLRRKHKALATVVNIYQRRKRWFAFWLWKVKILRWRQLDSVKTLWARTDLHTIMYRWKKYSTTQRKLRLFLTKRCLLSCAPNLPASIAFRLWKTKAAELTALEQVTTLHTKLRAEQNSSSTHLRKLALGKWCWIAYHHRLRQMRAFLSRCYVTSTKRNDIKQRRAIEEMQLNTEVAIAKIKEQDEIRAQEEMGTLSAAQEHLTSFHALQTLIRRLFQPTSVKDLFVSVATTFAQILHGTTAVLFLFDPSSNELWTQREENQLIQVPASLGIAGSTLSSGSTFIIADVAADPRFHPMVDQFVMNGLQQDDVTSAFMMTSRQASKPTVGMVSTALVSTDGAVYGILQVAFTSSSLSSIDRRVLVAQTQLYSKTCCFYVEQIIFEMLRNCRDRVRARAPDKFIKLFKQNKNWRKYYALIERKASDMESKLHQVLEERELLIVSKAELKDRYQQVKDKLELSERNTKDVSNLVTDWKKKLAKWQKVLDEKDRDIAEKTSELNKMEKEFERYQREQRTKEVQDVLNAPSPRRRSISSYDEECDEFTGKTRSFSDRGQLSILRADQTRLKSQLVRAEADNLLLVKAIGIARTQHGELPTTIQAEVTRVATRVSRRAPPPA
ncbi:hypothetical protein PHMEG_00015645 [Phytophthora megakarya]|uniref:Uncharacterized protein n=1 Tax=Phytophthora megakarya TaxID=4795 RepID=A0A225W175_9STRA|nr:hypothetical protein PHMEG_00015645 [Phytophthora megakarya]